MIPGLAIRTATLADAGMLAVLAAETFYETYGSATASVHMDAYVQKHFTAESFEAELRNPDAEVFVACGEGEALGYLSMHFQNPLNYSGHGKWMEVARLYVRRAYHGKKLGAALLSRCIETARENKFDHLWLAVWEKNEAAISFYRKFGFTILGTTTFDLGGEIQQDYLMQKSLMVHATEKRIKKLQ